MSGLFSLSSRYCLGKSFLTNRLAQQYNRHATHSVFRQQLTNIRQSTTFAKSAKATPNKVVKREGSYHWYFERALSVALLPIFGMSATYGSHPTNDYIMGVVLPLHIHVGLTSLIIDYLPFRRLPVTHCIFVMVQHIATVYSIIGCYYINSRDVGLTEYFKRIWTA